MRPVLSILILCLGVMLTPDIVRSQDEKPETTDISVSAIDWSSDGEYLAIVRDRRYVDILNRNMDIVTSYESSHSIPDLHWNPVITEQIALGLSDGQIQIASVVGANFVITHELSTGHEEVLGVRWNSSGTYLATYGGHEEIGRIRKVYTIEIRETVNFSLVSSFDTGYELYATHIEWVGTAKIACLCRIRAGSEPDHVIVWDVLSDQIVNDWYYNDTKLGHIRVNSSESYIAVESRDPIYGGAQTIIFNPITGQIIKIIDKSYPIIWSPGDADILMVMRLDGNTHEGELAITSELAITNVITDITIFSEVIGTNEYVGVSSATWHPTNGLTLDLEGNVQNVQSDLSSPYGFLSILPPVINIEN